MTFNFLRRSLLVAAVLSGSMACGRPADTPEEGAGVVRLHTSKCGACHAPVEPGTRSRDHLESAFARHEAQKRVRLSAQEWDAMVEYLSPK